MQQKLQMSQERVMDSEVSQADKDKLYKKLEKVEAVEGLMENFDNFVNEVTWNKRFEIPLKMYLDTLIDPCMRLFLDVEARGEVFDDEDGQAGQELRALANGGQDRSEKYSPEMSKSDKV